MNLTLKSKNMEAYEVFLANITRDFPTAGRKAQKAAAKKMLRDFIRDQKSETQR